MKVHWLVVGHGIHPQMSANIEEAETVNMNFSMNASLYLVHLLKFGGSCEFVTVKR